MKVWDRVMSWLRHRDEPLPPVQIGPDHYRPLPPKPPAHDPTYHDAATRITTVIGRTQLAERRRTWHEVNRDRSRDWGDE